MNFFRELKKKNQNCGTFQTELHWSNWETHILCLLWNFILREILRDLRCLCLATLHCAQFTQVRSLPGLPEQFQLSGVFPSSPESSNCLRVQLHLFHLVLCDRIPQLHLCLPGFWLEVPLKWQHWNFSWFIGGSECRTPQECPCSNPGQGQIKGRWSSCYASGQRDRKWVAYLNELLNKKLWI